MLNNGWSSVLHRGQDQERLFGAQKLLDETATLFVATELERRLLDPDSKYAGCDRRRAVSNVGGTIPCIRRGTAIQDESVEDQINKEGKI
jgi:hypothetical protein